MFLRIYVHEADRDLATTAKSFGKNDARCEPWTGGTQAAVEHGITAGAS
ncbi:MAG TPA: hypothetical protein VGL76_12300 [Gaiellaceae bacterium]